MDLENLLEVIENGGIKMENPSMSHISPQISIDDYLVQLLNIETLDADKRVLLKNNFIHLMGQVIADFALINQRLHAYRTERQQLEGVKSNQAEFRRRKLEYFAKLNKSGMHDIVDFLSDGIKEYLMEMSYDTLQRENEGDQFGKMYRNRRYTYALFPDYYDVDFDYSTVVKTTHMPGVDLFASLDNEKRFLELRKNDLDQYYTQLKRVIENNNVPKLLLESVSNNFHLHKRKEVFADLMGLYKEKRYQSFLNLGLLQLEGLFYDICSLKYEDKENAGSLVEKAEKALKCNNEISFMRLYPYFAYDVPVQRNEIAHTGLLRSDHLERMADELILDLYSVAKMALLESDGKFRIFWMIHDKLFVQETNTESNEISLSRTLFLELFANDMLASDSFWDILKKPEEYKDEIEFYKVDNLEEGYIDVFDAFVTR